MGEGRWRDAIREFEQERAIGGVPLDECQRLGEAWEKLGDRRRAAQWYRREIDIHPGNEVAHEGLRRIGASE